MLLYVSRSSVPGMDFSLIMAAPPNTERRVSVGMTSLAIR